MLMDKLGLKRALGGRLPEGCTACSRTDGEESFVFIMNFSQEEKTVRVEESARSLLTEEDIRGDVTLAPRGFDVLQNQKIVERSGLRIM